MKGWHSYTRIVEEGLAHPSILIKMGGTVLDEAGSPVVVNIEQPRWDQVCLQSHIFYFMANVPTGDILLLT